MHSRRLSRAIFFVFILIAPLYIASDRVAALGTTITPQSLSALDVASTQNFDTLANVSAAPAVMSNVLPTGWGLDESGTSARNDGKYTASTGSDTAGDTYGFGTPSGNTDRALGTLRSGTLVPIIGAGFTNNTGATIATLDISYAGEQWRLGVTNRGASDRLDFQYSLNATSLTTGTWIDADSLDFATPAAGTTGTAGARDGNNASFRSAISGSISGLAVAPGAAIWIRWTDFDISSSDDGLAVDDFSITPHTTTDPTGVAAASPTSVLPGNQTLLTVTVTPGSNPVSTGLAVTGDLVPIGGSATQAFFDNGSNGDVTPNDNVFSYAATVAAGTSSGPKTLAAVVSDAQARSTNAQIALTVLPTFHAIHDIQGSGNLSPYAGQAVTTTGIVTGVKSNGFFMQTADADIDALPASSEGIFVFTGAPIPAGAVIGNAVNVTGTVQEFIPSSDPSSPPTTEIAFGPSVTLVSTGNTLPAPITLTAADTSPGGTIEQLERFEGMRVHVDSLTVVAPTEGFKSEPNATSTSNGVFYGVITGIARPFREPGIELPDPVPAGPCCVPRFDANPERIRVDSDAQYPIPVPPGALMDVTAGATVTNLTGPLDYSARAYTILPDVATPPGASGNTSATPVPMPGVGQFTIASFNMERFFDTVNDPGISDVALTTTAFNNRLNKASLAIRNVLRTPDIIGVQEMENLATLEAIASKVNADAVIAGDPSPNYQAYLVEGNDIGGIDVGFLVKAARVTVMTVTQEGKTTTYIDPNSGLPDLLNDRPPLVLEAQIQPPSGSPYAITVINNHLRSLSGVDDPVDGNRVRTKRRAQAEYLATLIQARQMADPNERIISIGDYNAFQFNDGYVDGIGTIKGTPTPATHVVLASLDLVNPNLIDLVELAAPAQRYSFVFDGNAQELDHLLITGNLLTRFVALNYARNDADFPESYRSDPTRPERLSDHDPSVAYFTFPTADLSVAKSPSANPVLSGSSLAYTITVENTLSDVAENVIVADHAPAGTTFTSFVGPGGWDCSGPDGGGLVQCKVSSLGANATATLTFTVGVGCSLANTTPIANTVSVTSDTFDPNALNNSSTVNITVSNPAPIVVAPDDATYQLASQVPAASPADATVTDNCGTPTVAVVESTNGGAGSPASPLIITRVYTATDSANGSSSDTQTITVIDDTPPTIDNLAVDKGVLAPPNHKMQLVTLTYHAADNGPAPSIVLSVGSNEPVNGTGDGDTAPDWEVVDATHVQLRAERSGTGLGRVYTIHVVATDAAGNTTVADVQVLVPHNR